MFEENLQLKNGAFGLGIGQPLRPKNQTFSDVFVPAARRKTVAEVEQAPITAPAPIQGTPDTAVLPDFLLHPVSVQASTIGIPGPWSVRRGFMLTFVASLGLIAAGVALQAILNRQFVQAATVELPPVNKATPAYTAVLGAHTGASVAYDLPKSLEIAPLNIHANINSADFTKNGNLTKSIDTHEVAWNKASSKPGKQGTMVIASNTYSCVAPGVFSNLKDISLGTDILVTNGAGLVTDYKVIRTQVLEQSKVNLETLSDPPVHYRPGLNIVTCADNNETGKRLLVNAVLYD